MNHDCAHGCKSRCQAARIVSENWAEVNLYCAACESDRLTRQPNNTEAVDFRCAACSSAYQLKATKSYSERRIPDAGYHAMMRALFSDTVPNLLVLQYGSDWSVRNLLLVPSFFFSPVAVEKRKPLGPSARRAGWIGCNILLSEIADAGKIRVVSDGSPLSAQIVRDRYRRVRPLASIGAKSRGWTLDVLRMARKIGRSHFALEDMYTYEDELRRIYPTNRNVKPKIRQQLQVLRDIGLVKFEGQGKYELLC